MQILPTGEYSGEIIQQVETDQVIITNTYYSSKAHHPHWHSHENLHICLVFQGGKSETLRTTKYSEKGGSIFFYHAGEKHRWSTQDPVSKSINIEVGTDFLHTYHTTEFEIKEALESRVDAKSLMLKIQREILFQESERGLSIQSLLLELLSHPVNPASKNPPKWVKRLSHLLQDNWNEALILSQIAQILEVHPVTISKNFRKYFGCTLGEYRRRLKIEQSIGLIKTTQASLSQIAVDCGFADQSHFIRNFKSNTGFLPKDFRNY